MRIAARRQIQLAAAPLYPSLNLFGTINGSGATLGPGWQLEPGTVSTVALASTTTTPLANLTGGPFGTLSKPSTGTVYNTGDQLTLPHYVDRSMRLNYAIGLNVQWNYPNLGVPTLSSIQGARANARIALLNSNQQLINIFQQVRESYLNSQTAERQIEVADKAVVSGTEELRLSRVRLANGVGTNIDVINSQRDFITALVNKANAIITFNVAQAQLLHDIGLVSVESLTSGRLVRQ